MRTRWGILLSAPYLIFIGVVFAFPLIFAVWMSFHDYFFAAPGADVQREFVGFDNFIAVATDPAVWRSFLNVGIFLIINVPLTVVLSLLLATALNRVVRGRLFLRVSFYVPYVTASVAVVGRVAVHVQRHGLVNQVLGPLAPDPSWLINPVPGHADDRLLRHLEAAGLLHPAVPRGAAGGAAGALRVGRHRRGGRRAHVLLGDRAGRAVRRRCWFCCSRRSPARTCSPSRTCSRTAAGPTGHPRHRSC